VDMVKSGENLMEACVAVLTCNSVARSTFWDESLIETSVSWFPLKFLLV